MSTLRLENIELYYNRVHALRDLSIEVNEGEIVSLLGNNGAGKTSTLSMLSGLVRPKSGTAMWGDLDLTKLNPWNLVDAGLIHVPEGRRILSTMTVHENLLLGGYLVKDQNLIDERVAYAYELMPRLLERKTQQGGTLSGGEQQMLAIGRALVSGPKLLLLDEPSMGLAPLIVRQVMDIVRTVARMACPDNELIEKFVAAQGNFGRYNSQLPVVVFVPKEVELKYKVWKAHDTKVADKL